MVTTSALTYRGAFQPDSSHFVGWNGGENEKISSQEILDKALLLPNSGELIESAGYTKNHVDFEKAIITFKKDELKNSFCMGV